MIFLLQASLPCFSQGIISLDLLTLKRDNDSLLIEYTIKPSGRVVKKGQGLCICPILQAGDSLLFLPKITILGRNKYKVLNRYYKNIRLGHPPVSIEADEFKPLSYKLRVPYRSWMDRAGLCIRQEVSGYRGSKVVTRYLFSGGGKIEANALYE